MAVSHAQKVATLDYLKAEVVPQKAVVLLNTNGAKESLTATLNASLRSQVKEQGVSLKVIKNTLIKIAFKDAEGFPEEFVGSTYVAFLDNKEDGDEVTVPKAVVSLVKKEFKDNINVLGSVVDGQFYDELKTVALSKTPSLQESMATVAGMLSSLAGGKIATLVKEIPAKVSRGVCEYSKTLS